MSNCIGCYEDIECCESCIDCVCVTCIRHESKEDCSLGFVYDRYLAEDDSE